MKTLFLIVFLGAVSAFAFAEPELKGSPQDLRGFLFPADKVVTISGEAEERAYSDKAIVSLVITTEDKLLSQSISSNNALREKITSLFIDAGITPAAIKSSKFSSSPQYGWFGDKPSSYKIVNRMAVSITQEAHLKEIASVADKYEEVELSDMAFEHTGKDEYNHKVKAKALANIIKQKEFYEKSLGLKLTAIGIRDANIFQHATRGAMVLEKMSAAAAKSDREVSSYAAVGQEPIQPSFDEVEYQANLSVDFKIEP